MPSPVAPWSLMLMVSASTTGANRSDRTSGRIRISVARASCPCLRLGEKNTGETPVLQGKLDHCTIQIFCARRGNTIAHQRRAVDRLIMLGHFRRHTFSEIHLAHVILLF